MVFQVTISYKNLVEIECKEESLAAHEEAKQIAWKHFLGLIEDKAFDARSLSSEVVHFHGVLRQLLANLINEAKATNESNVAPAPRDTYGQHERCKRKR